MGRRSPERKSRNRSAGSTRLPHAAIGRSNKIDDKPVALVAHGTTGGAQAVANLRNALPGVGAITVPQALYFSDKLADSISSEGELAEEISNRPYGPQAQLAMQIESLVWYTGALKAARPSSLL